MARKMTGRLVALSAAAIASVYGVGYLHTEPAAQRLVAADTLSTASATASTGYAASPPEQVIEVPARGAPSVATQSASLPILPPSRTDQRRGGGGRRGDSGGAFQPLPAPTPLPVLAGAPSTTSASTAALAYHDGSYTGMGENRHGDVQVTVVIGNGRIASAAISDCGMQYPCSRIAMLPGQVVARQNTEVDLVSGATMSSTAYQDAVAQALAKASA